MLLMRCNFHSSSGYAMYEVVFHRMNFDLMVDWELGVKWIILYFIVCRE